MKVAIVGGGVIGLSSALELARSGHSVTVFDPGPGRGEASGAAGGMLAPQLEAHTPGPFLELCRASRQLYPSWAGQLLELSGVDIGYLASGSLQLAFTAAQVESLETSVRWQRQAGLPAQFLSGEEARALEPHLGPTVLAAARHGDDHHCEPRRLMRALAVAGAAAGVIARTGLARRVLERGGRAVGVEAEGVEFLADAVVLAAGAWAGQVEGTGLEPARFQPVRGQMVELQVPAPLTRLLLKGPGGYLVPRPDGRLLAGSTMEFVGFDARVTPEGLTRVLGAALEMVPALAQATVVASWAGLRPGLTDRLPLLGPGPLPGLTLAVGHLRNGILLAPLTARVVGQLVRGDPPSFDLNPFRYGRFSS
jgi:glycine oxidase